MKISVVTVCYNSEATIARTIASFLEQTWADKEMLVIDGASQDKTIEVVRSFDSGAVRVVSERDSGMYDAMNKGLKMFSGDAVGFLNSDDVYHDRHVLGRIAQELETADAVYGDLVMVRDHAARQAVRTWTAGPFHRGAFRRGWMPPHPTFYVRRSLAERVGTFDLQYRISADYDFMLRALELQAARVRYCPLTLVDFMTGGKSTRNLRAVIDGNLECLRSRQMHLRAAPIDAALFLKPMQKLQQVHWAR